MDSLTGISAFVQVCESRSFVDAGRQLGISASAVGKCIARLEERLAVRLFDRGTGNLVPTVEGTLFLSRCRCILNDVDAAERELLHAACFPAGRQLSAG